MGPRAQKSRATAEDWPALLRRCQELGITARDLEDEQASVEAALAAINEARKSPSWKAAQRDKLRKRVHIGWG
jgi:hypothetical protein